MKKPQCGIESCGGGTFQSIIGKQPYSILMNRVIFVAFFPLIFLHMQGDATCMHGRSVVEGVSQYCT